MGEATTTECCVRARTVELARARRGIQRRAEQHVSFQLHCCHCQSVMVWWPLEAWRTTEEEDHRRKTTTTWPAARSAEARRHAREGDEPRMGRTGGDMESWSWTPAELLPSRACQQHTQLALPLLGGVRRRCVLAACHYFPATNELSNNTVAGKENLDTIIQRRWI